MARTPEIEAALEKFAKILEEQNVRIEKMKTDKDFVDYEKMDKIVIGVCGGDGIGPAITHEAHRILEKGY